MSHPDSQVDTNRSPKRFFKGLTGSPFRQSTGQNGRASQFGKNLFHARSLSHEAFQAKHSNSHPSNDWASLIPPIPVNTSLQPTDSASSGLSDQSHAPQRHSIAVSPISSRNIPEMLQPLPDPEREKEFLFPQKPPYGSAPGSRSSSLTLVKKSATTVRKDQAPSLSVPQAPQPAYHPTTPAAHSQAPVRSNPGPLAPSSAPLPSKEFPSQPNASNMKPLPPQSSSPRLFPKNQPPTQPPQRISPQRSRTHSDTTQKHGTQLADNHSATYPPAPRGHPIRNPFYTYPTNGPGQANPAPPASLPPSSLPPNMSDSFTMPNAQQRRPLVPPYKSKIERLPTTRMPSGKQNKPVTPKASLPDSTQLPVQQLSSKAAQESPSKMIPANKIVTPPMLSRKQLAQLHTQQAPFVDPKAPPQQRKKKVCHVCNLPISGQFVRALNAAYHIECFACHECGKQCSAKFFPDTIDGPDGEKIQVPLCEYDYFKKLDLICFDCNNALRGPYITALGNKYHVEHFKCSECGKVFDSDESYYEHENNIYCHFHYSNLFATKCEGCQSSIVKQFVELFKGGKNQQWHPECYMVYKFWNVNITADTVGLQNKFQLEKSDVHDFLNNELDPSKLVLIEQQIENVVMSCWMVLSGFEEALASCVSEMLLSACTGKRSGGLAVTRKLILFVEILFSALDFVEGMCKEYEPSSLGKDRNGSGDEVYLIDAFDNFQPLRKEPRNISGKLMSYLAILRKSSQLSDSGSLSAELLSVITGCAHYLKLLFRIGLNNALKLNKLRGDTRALDGFLRSNQRYEEIEAADRSGDIAFLDSRLAVPSNATDACRKCKKSIEKSCYRFKNLRWHTQCFECSVCRRKPSSDYKIESFLCGADDSIICLDCSKANLKSGMSYQFGFTYVSDLSQLVYLLKIAVHRSKLAMKKDEEPLKRGDTTRKSSAMSNIAEEGGAVADTETVYSRTLSDVTSIRTKRESQKLSGSVRKSARKSVILEAPEADVAKEDSMDSSHYPETSRKPSTSSSISFVPLQNDSDQFNFTSRTKSLKIKDEPSHAVTSGCLGRTSDMLKNEKSLTLDDIPRIVAAEQARDQRPNAFKHHNSLYEKTHPLLKSSNKVDMPQFKGSNELTINKTTPVLLKSKYYGELSKAEHFILRHIAVEAFVAIQSRFSKEELTSLIQTRKLPTFWDKFKFGGGEKGKSMNVFGTDLQDLTKKYGVDSDLGIGPAQLRIPIVVDDVINSLRKKDMSVEGIFRLNGNIKHLRELTELINKSPLKSPDFNNYSAVQLAALLKKWLRELPNPLLTFNLHDMWMSSRKQGDSIMCKRILQLAYCMLPRSHRNLLEVLLGFFRWVASFASTDEESGSKMDTHNLATVIAPNILFSRDQASDGAPKMTGDSYFLAIEVVNQMIEIHEELAMIAPDLWDFYEKCQFQNMGKLDTLTTKDIFARIQKVLKENPGFFKNFISLEESSQPSHQNTIKRGNTKVHTDPQENGS